MSDKTSIQLVSKFIEFAIPSLLEYPIDFQLFLSRICSLVAVEVTALAATPRTSLIANGFSRASTDRLSFRRSPLASSTVDQQKSMEKILSACYPDQNIVRKEIKIGVGRFRVHTEHGFRLYEHSTLIKEISPEQVRVFLSDGLAKSKSTSGVLLSATGIGGAQRLDLFGVPVSEEELIPVVFMAHVPKDPERVENFLMIADEVIRFLMKNDETNTDRDSVAKIFTVMPKILHVVSQLLNYMETHGARLRAPVGSKSPSIKVPEYSALSLSGGRTVVSTATPEGSLTRITTTPLPIKTVITRTVSTTPTVNVNGVKQPSSIITIPGVSKRTVTSIRGGTGTVTERTILTTQMRSMSMPKRYGREDRATIQREIERFNQQYGA